MQKFGKYSGMVDAAKANIKPVDPDDEDSGTLKSLLSGGMKKKKTMIHSPLTAALTKRSQKGC